MCVNFIFTDYLHYGAKTMDSIDYAKLTVVKLKVELVKRDLDTKDRKAALIKLLHDHDAPDHVNVVSCKFHNV